MTHRLADNISVAALMVVGDDVADTSVGRLTHRGDICPYVRRGRTLVSQPLSDANDGNPGFAHVTWEVGDSVHRVLGYPPERFTSSADFWSALLHRDDRELAQRVMSATSESDQHVFHYRLLDAAGEYRWIRDEFRVIRQSDGDGVLCVGCWMDLGGQDSVDNAALAGEFRELELLVDVLAARAQQFLATAYSEHLQQNLRLSQLRIRKLQERLSPQAATELNADADDEAHRSRNTQASGARIPVRKRSAESWLSIREMTNALIKAAQQPGSPSQTVAVIVALTRRPLHSQALDLPLTALNVDALSERGFNVLNSWQDSGQLLTCVTLPDNADAQALSADLVIRTPYSENSLISVQQLPVHQPGDDHIRTVTAALFSAQRDLAQRLWRHHRNESAGAASEPDGNLALYAQPTAALDSLGRATLDWEVLLRISNDDGTMQSPRELIAVATRYGLMLAIDAWVLETTLAELQRQGDMQQLPGIAINLSMQTWMNPATPDLLLRYVAHSVLRPRQVSFEIQEPTLAAAFTIVCEQIEQIREAGFRVTLDDFGAGNVSLNQLRDASLDAVKISGGLIAGDRANPGLLGAMASMAMSLDLVTIGKHAQHKQTLQLLAKLGVHAVQGRVVNPPVSFPDFLATLN